MSQGWGNLQVWRIKVKLTQFDLAKGTVLKLSAKDRGQEISVRRERATS